MSRMTFWEGVPGRGNSVWEGKCKGPRQKELRGVREQTGGQWLERSELQRRVTSCRGCRDGTRGKCGWAMGGRVEGTPERAHLAACSGGPGRGTQRRREDRGLSPNLPPLSTGLSLSCSLARFLQVEARSLGKMRPQLESIGPWNGMVAFLDPGEPAAEERKGTDSPESQGLTALPGL